MTSHRLLTTDYGLRFARYGGLREIHAEMKMAEYS